jgi:excinuclease ABC subunit B
VDDLLTRCREKENQDQRVLVTTLTKRLAEDLTEYIQNMGVRTRYLHSDIDTLERVSIIQSLRQGEFSVLVGINLLREGLDIPEVALVAILDADKEGFLRSTRSLIQTFGRAARNTAGEVVMYADTVTASMQRAMEETERRRELQMEHNREHGITPQSIIKDWENPLYAISGAARPEAPLLAAEDDELYAHDPREIAQRISSLEKQMRKLAADLEFEKAAELRDRIASLRETMLALT